MPIKLYIGEKMFSANLSKITSTGGRLSIGGLYNAYYDKPKDFSACLNILHLERNEEKESKESQKHNDFVSLTLDFMDKTTPRPKSSSLSIAKIDEKSLSLTIMIGMNKQCVNTGSELKDEMSLIVKLVKDLRLIQIDINKLPSEISVPIIAEQSRNLLMQLHTLAIKTVDSCNQSATPNITKITRDCLESVVNILKDETVELAKMLRLSTTALLALPIKKFS